MEKFYRDNVWFKMSFDAFKELPTETGRDERLYQLPFYWSNRRSEGKQCNCNEAKKSILKVHWKEDQFIQCKQWSLSLETKKKYINYHI